MNSVALEGNVETILSGPLVLVRGITPLGNDMLRKSEPKPVEQKPVEERVETPSYLKALSIVFICFVLIVFGIPFVLAFFYVAQGFSSVAIYSQPIGEVMSFYYMAAKLLATVSAAQQSLLLRYSRCQSSEGSHSLLSRGRQPRTSPSDSQVGLLEKANIRLDAYSGASA